MRMPLLLLLAVVFAVPAFANQTVWKWVDAQGVTHYSDRPVPGATKLELNVGTGRQAPRAATAQTDTPATAEPSGPVYRNFEIWKPGNEEAIINTGGAVTIDIRVDPPLQTGHRLYLLLDGKQVQGFPENATSYDLQQVPRGTHTAIAVITDRRNTRIQQTEPVTFHVRQHSIAQPPVGPALRSQPKSRSGGTANKLPTKQPSYADLNGPRPQIDPRTNAPPPVKPKPKPKASEQGH